MEENNNNLQRCVSVGTAFGRNSKDDTPVFADNVRGLVRGEDMTLPASENAMSVGADGQPLIAWTLVQDGTYCYGVYKTRDGACGFIQGLPRELLSHELERVTRDLVGMEKRKG